MTDKKITVAQIRGDGLSDRETKTWEYFPPDIVQTVFRTHKNIYSQSSLPFPIVKLHSSSDNFLFKNFYKYFFGQYKRMFGLEKKLASFDIAHVGEIYNYYTYQAVQAKKLNSKLKVVATVWENTFGRFEYNYWPGFKMPPRYWRDKLKKIMDGIAVGVDKFLPISHDAAGLLLDYGVPSEKVQVVVPGIIPPPTNIQPVFPPGLIGKEIYLMTNRLVKEKGVYEILYGWRIYLSKTSQRQQKVLAVIGEGPERENLVRLVEDWHLQESIIFIRQLPYDQFLGVYKNARCLILGSIPRSDWQEQFGYVLAEAICAGVPSIATYCGAIPEVVGTAGLLVPPAHPIALANALLKIEDPTVYNQLKAACEVEKKKFAVEEYVRQVAEVYRNLTV